MAIKIGLTGGIGSGKTTVAKIFELLEVPVYYADDAAKRLYETNEDLMELIKKHFGKDVYSGNHLNRKKLAMVVFNNGDKLKLLNEIVHPLTIRDATEWMDKQNSPYILKEAALLFESHSSDNLDYIIGVSAPEELRIARAMERDNISREDVINRIQHQMDEEKKMKLCNFIIINDEAHLIIPQVMELHKSFLKMATTVSL